MTISFIVKGSAKNKSLVDSFIGKVHALNKYRQVIVEYTEYPGHAIYIAKKHTEKEVNIIIAMGGDGTLNEVLNGIMSTDKNKPALDHFP